MKKILKRILCLSVAFVCMFGLVACKTPLSQTTTDVSKTVYNGQNTNGGVTAVYNGYLYFINGTKTNDGKSATGNKKSAICRVKIDEDGKIDDKSYEVVVDNLVGYTNGSINFFGDFMYFTTPNDKVNNENLKLNYQTNFMRYDLVNKKSYVLYTTSSNSSSASISYAYYVKDGLNLLVYESANSKLTSLKIGDSVTTNYVIDSIKTCLFSENYGKCVTEGQSVDANSFVYYTKDIDVYEDGIASGTKIYKVSPTTKEDSVNIYKGENTVTLLTIKNGNLVYSSKGAYDDSTAIYYQMISASKTEKLNFLKKISYTTYDNIIFVENENGTVAAISLNANTNDLLYLEADENNNYEITPKTIYTLAGSTASSSSDDSTSSNLSLVSLETYTEGEDEVTYLIYIISNVVYKLEVMRNGYVSTEAEQIKLSKSNVSAPSGKLVPEVVGNYLYIFAKEVDDKNAETSNIYLHRVNIVETTEDSTDYATIVAIKE